MVATRSSKKTKKVKAVKAKIIAMKEVPSNAKAKESSPETDHVPCNSPTFEEWKKKNCKTLMRVPLFRSMTKEQVKMLYDRCITAIYIVHNDAWPKDNELILLEAASASLLVPVYYRLWMPLQVKIVIIAESHAYTHPSILGCTSLTPNAKSLLKELGLPTFFGHLNLVHCLTYGESSMFDEETLKKLPHGVKRSISQGTPRFWMLLVALAGGFDASRDGHDPLTSKNDMRNAMEHILGRNANQLETLETRLRAKVWVLNELKRRGILLIDNSAIAIYKGTTYKRESKTGNMYTTKKNFLPAPEFKRVMQVFWETYTKHLVKQLNPDKVLILGSMVAEAIGGHSKIQHDLGDNIKYLGHRTHPSYNRLTDKQYLPSLNECRNLGLECDQEASLCRPLVAVGTKVRKYFDVYGKRTPFYGRVACNVGAHLVMYDDGDSEEFHFNDRELNSIVVAARRFSNK